MTVILATDSGEKYWYERAWREGLGAICVVPDTIEDIDRFLGLFAWNLSKKIAGSFLVLYYDKSTSPAAIAHAHAMCAVLPRSALCIHKNGDASCAVERVGQVEDQELERLAQKVSVAHAEGKKIMFMYESLTHHSDDEVARDVRELLSLEPDFLATTHTRHAAEALRSLEGGSRLKRMLRAPQLLKWRVMLGRWRTTIKEMPMKVFVDVFESMTGRQIMIHTRPLYASDYTELPNRFHTFPRCTIVLQGPLALKRSFTLETVRLYKKIFPYADIIVSTWEKEDEDILRALRESGATVVLSKPPAVRGWGNVNMQIVSAAAGIKEAAKRGAEYVLKQRTDQRIYNAIALEMMIAMLAHFPPGKKTHQKKRILFGNAGPALTPYWMSEILFGDVEDIAEYYAVSEIPTDKAAYSTLIIESFLPSDYLRRKGWKLDWTVQQGMEVYKECFIPLDWWMLDLLWYKYWRYDSHLQRSYVYSVPTRSHVLFGEWLSMVVDGSNKLPNPEQRFVFEIAKRERK